MAYVNSGETYNLFEIMVNRRFTDSFVFNNQRTNKGFYFSVGDYDINYELAQSANTTTTFSNVPTRGNVPSYTGIYDFYKFSGLTQGSLNMVRIEDSDSTTGIIKTDEDFDDVYVDSNCVPLYTYFILNTGNVSSGDTIEFTLNGIVFSQNFSDNAGLISYVETKLLNDLNTTGFLYENNDSIIVYMTQQDVVDNIVNLGQLVCEISVEIVNGNLQLEQQFKCCSNFI